MVPPRGRMPLTSFRVSSRDFSGQIRPSKPSGTPMTFHLYLRMADFTAARMTALRPGASPPPVQMPIHLISDIVRVQLLVDGHSCRVGNNPLGWISRSHVDHLIAGDS